MRKSVVVLAIILLSFSVFAFTNVSPDDQKYEIGDTIDNFELMTIEGKPFDLYSNLDSDGSKGVLIMLVSWKCPVSNNCNERMVKIAEFCKNNNLTFVGMNPNTVYYDGPNEVVLAEAKKANFNFEILRDLNARFADKFKMAATPTSVLIDTDRKLRYRGRIDDSHGRVGQTSPPPKEHTLMDNLNTFLAGGEIVKKETRSPGCGIKRVERYYGTSYKTNTKK